jgi:hypothetical protein
MREGWCKDEYLVLFDESEIAIASERYAISQLLPDFEIIGLLGYDDFIVRNSSGHTYSIPTVPLIDRHLKSFPVQELKAALTTDTRFTGKIKWYVKPLVFGGNPSDENIQWVNYDQHSQLVRFWNDKYRELVAQQKS